MAYIDVTYVDAMIGLGLRASLFDDGSGYEAAKFDVVVAAAEARVRGALRTAGYEPPNDAALAALDAEQRNNIKAAVLGAFIATAYGRRQIPVPQEYMDQVMLVANIKSGDLRFPGLVFTPRDGVGGVLFSESDETVDGSRPQIFSRDMGR